MIPSLDRVWGNGTTVSLDFSEAMATELATDPGNFTLTASDGNDVAVTSAELGAAPDILVLTTASALELDGDYQLSVHHLTDLAGKRWGRA